MESSVVSPEDHDVSNKVLSYCPCQLKQPDVLKEVVAHLENKNPEIRRRCIELLSCWATMPNLVYDLCDTVLLFVPTLVELLLPKWNMEDNLGALSILRLCAAREDMMTDCFEDARGPARLQKLATKYDPIEEPEQYNLIMEAISALETEMKNISPSKRTRTFGFGFRSDISRESASKLDPSSLYCEHGANGPFDLVVSLQLGSIDSHDVGWKVWEGGYILAEWIYANREVISKTSSPILELGAGPGLPGLVAANYVGHPGGVLLSDWKDEIIELLDRNIGLNPHLRENVRAVLLDWRDIPQDMRESFEIIIAAEVLYHKEAAEPLADAVAALLKKGGSFYCVSMEEKYRMGLRPFLAALLKYPHLSVSTSLVPDQFISEFATVNEWLWIEVKDNR